MSSDKWSIQNRRLCFHCALPIGDPGIEICPRCGSQDISERSARPHQTNQDYLPTLPFPWNQQRLRPGSTVLLSGGPGSGKTSSCIKLNPTAYITTEQEVQQVSHAWYRLMPDQKPPVISNCYSMEQLDEDLMGLAEGEIGVIDSISQFADGIHSSRIMKKVIERARDQGAIIIFIAQFTKAGEMKGPNMLNHMVDVICKIPQDDLGLRQLKAEKNRGGDLWSQYFTFNERGELIPQEFEYAYTIEGPSGNYHLHLFPMAGSKLGGIFKVLSENKVDITGMASAGVKCNGYSTGFAEPPDAPQRRMFAEKHGLTWVDPQTAKQLLIEKAQEEPEF